MLGLGTLLRPMMELPMTSLHSNLKPPIGLKELDEFLWTFMRRSLLPVDAQPHNVLHERHLEAGEARWKVSAQWRG
jgi:hypothetical protein